MDDRKKQWRSGVFGPFRILVLQQFLAIHFSLAQFVALSMTFFTFTFFTSLNFFKVEHFGCYRCCNKIFVTFANFAKLADHKRSLFTYIMLLLNLLFLRHLLACFFLIQSFHIARKSLVIFAIFAKFADFSKPFLTSSLSKCRLFNS